MPTARLGGRPAFMPRTGGEHGEDGEDTHGKKAKDNTEEEDEEAAEKEEKEKEGGQETSSGDSAMRRTYKKQG